MRAVRASSAERISADLYWIWVVNTVSSCLVGDRTKAARDAHDRTTHLYVTTDEAFRNDQAISWIFLCGGGSLAYFVWLTPHWWSDLVYMVLLGLAGLVALSCGYTLWSSKQNDYFYSVTVDALGLQFLDHERRLTSLPWSHIAGVQEASVRKGIELQELSGKTRYLPATLEHFTELVDLIAAQTSSFQPPAFVAHDVHGGLPRPPCGALPDWCPHLLF